MALRVVRHETVEAFRERAEAWLLRAEAEHNLILGLERKLTDAPDTFDPPIYLATIERVGAICGCAFRTPPYKLGLTRMPLEAIPALVESVADVYEALPAVLGPEAETRAFAEVWAAHRGVRAVPGMRQRIYQLTEVQPPVPPVPGHLRPARPADHALLTTWIGAFHTETGIQSAPAIALRLIDEEKIWIWEDGQPVSMMGTSGYTPHGARIGYVYTPPDFRRRGYAAAGTAALSRQLLDAGLRFCFLYTDLANPTSNSVYQRIGYSPVADVMDYDFEEG